MKAAMALSSVWPCAAGRRRAAAEEASFRSSTRLGSNVRRSTSGAGDAGDAGGAGELGGAKPSVSCAAPDDVTVDSSDSPTGASRTAAEPSSAKAYVTASRVVSAGTTDARRAASSLAGRDARGGHAPVLRVRASRRAIALPELT